MCPAECKEVFKTNIEAIIHIFQTNLKEEMDKLTGCFFNCFKPEFLKRSAILYNSYPPDLIAFISDNSFTDSVLLFKERACEGKLYDGSATLKTILLSFYTNKLRQHLQTEKRLAEKKEKHALTYKGAVLELNDNEEEANEKRYASLEKAMAKMDAADRQIVIWRHLEEKTCDEIATILGITKASATNRIYRCMERLRDITQNNY